MRTNLKKIVKHTGTIYGQDISNELHNKKVVSIDKPQHAQAVLDHHKNMFPLKDNMFMCLQSARASKEKVFIGTAEIYPDTAIVFSELKNVV